jgi:hypothetical protein
MGSSQPLDAVVLADEALPALESVIEVAPIIKVDNEPLVGDSARPISPAEVPGGEAREPRKPKRRSGNSVDLTYRYHEPSDDELSWTDDEHGNRRRRKSHKRKSGGGDDFKNGIVYDSPADFLADLGLPRGKRGVVTDKADGRKVMAMTICILPTLTVETTVPAGMSASNVFTTNSD